MCTMSHCTGAAPLYLEHSNALVKLNEDGSADLTVHPAPGRQPHLGRAVADLRGGTRHTGGRRQHRHGRHRRHPLRVRLRRQPFHVRYRRRHAAGGRAGQGATAGARRRDAGRGDGRPGVKDRRVQVHTSRRSAAAWAMSATTPSTASAATPPTSRASSRSSRSGTRPSTARTSPRWRWTPRPGGCGCRRHRGGHGLRHGHQPHGGRGPARRAACSRVWATR